MQSHFSGNIFFYLFIIVSYHYNQMVLRKISKQFHDLRSGFTVQVTGWLIRHNNIRILCQRTSNRQSLLLTTGQLRRTLVSLCTQAYPFQIMNCLVSSFFLRHSHDQKRTDDIFFGGIMTDQTIILKNKADLSTTIFFPVIFIILKCRLSIHIKLPIIKRIHTANDPKQC